MTDFTQWSTLASVGPIKPMWVAPEDQQRIGAYLKYDQIYWNDPTQYALRVLEGEEPVYVPNARVVVDTTAHYIMKGLELRCTDPTTTTALKAFLDRETFYSKFHTAKHRGVAIGDYVFHLTADPNKAEGSRISINSVDPAGVFPIWDEDEPTRLVGCHLAYEYYLPDEPSKTRIRKLTYRREQATEDGPVRISREEGIYELDPKWYGKEPKLVKQILPLGYLDERITVIPVYWFKNKAWDGDDFGSSEIRGFEALLKQVSQSSTDVNAALALEGLGVYATDGGRPVDDTGNESVWEVAPGKVMEVPTGSYFRRVEGVGSITPAVDNINYLESKLREGTSLSDVALGRVDVQTAESGIALAIKFMPTLAKVEDRDRHAVDRLRQMFHDWKTWHQVFEFKVLNGEIEPVIGDKLPIDRTAKVNELNNMLDRKIISIQYYRDEMIKLGYTFPDDMDAQIAEEAKRAAEAAAAAAPPELQPNAVAAATGAKPPPANGGMAEKVAAGNRSNNRNRPNESGGTESGQSLERQARGGTSRS